MFFKDKNLYEDNYSLLNEPKHSALFTTGNGYMGVRGSFEEFGSSRVQGAFVRGLFDKIVEVMEPFPDNSYMKKYYFNEQKLKDFELQDSCVNFADFLLCKFIVKDKTFYPWEGKILEWKRYLNFYEETLVREVLWQDDNGNITKFTFERFASYNDRHLYVSKCSALAINHNEQIKVITGIDKKVRTGGQRVIKEISDSILENEIYYNLLSGEHFKYQIGISQQNLIYFDGELANDYEPYSEKGIIAHSKTFANSNKEITVVKKTIINTERDHTLPVMEFAKAQLSKHINKDYQTLKNEHIKEYLKVFKKLDIVIGGDNLADDSLRFSNYHTVISAELNDSVHGLSAKSLSGEKYNQFVWWDAEIYQLKPFIYAMPEIAKNAIKYRYNQLEDAKQNAIKEKCLGARFPFVSSIDGQEKVWIYARHPHLQVHITADVAYSIINYYEVTGDYQTLLKYGYDILYQTMLYWISRSTLIDGKYHILNVTGTDEHHPYVDDDAYTNYLVKLVFDKAIKYFENDKTKLDYISNEKIIEFKNYAENIYLPLENGGMIPQFKGYFSLDRKLQIEGHGEGKSFQMKQAGLYHLSQVIKQPDVMLLHSYINYPFDKDSYAQNWDHYENLCESSSSLSYPVHAICSIDNNRFFSFYKYFMQTVRVDLDDIHNCAWQGIHAGCASGGYYSILRGLFGVKTNGSLSINPKPLINWDKLQLNFEYKGIRIFCELTQDLLVLELPEGKINANICGKDVLLEGTTKFNI